MKRSIMIVVVVFVLAAAATALDFPGAFASTCTADVPMGALAPARPIWCETLQAGVDTHVAAANAWRDDFNHGQSMAHLSSAYRSGVLGNGDALHFQHNNHWMVDLEAHGAGALIGAWMRPDRAFTVQADGSVVVEFEVAVPIAGTRDMPTLSDSWPELVVSTAPQPPGMQSWGSAIRRNGTYLYEAFPGYWTFGCRMQQSRHPICAMYMDDFGTAGTKPSRVWEINQNGGEVTSQFGGDPSVSGLADVWKSCSSTADPDVVCRNHFRWELRATHVLLLVNGVRFYEAGLIDSALDNVLRAPGGFYVYYGDFAYRMDPGRALRFHWDHVAVNPASVAAPVATALPTLSPTSSPTTVAATPTLVQRTSTPTPTPTPEDDHPRGRRKPTFTPRPK